jgi:xanthine dehydrogenase accessory factor
VQDYPLGPLLNQCCGGKVRLLVEHVDLAHAPWLQEAPGTRQLIANLTESRVERRWQSGPAAAPLTARGERPKAGACFKEPQEAALLPVLMFGAGHVGQAIIAASHGLPLAFDWQDNRAELTGFEALKLREAEAMIEAARQCPADTALLILTHDHALDYRLLAAALESKARFIGMIGSETKRARFISRLEKEGIGAADIARLICPIGHRHVQGKQPAVIAIAVLAQLLGLR